MASFIAKLSGRYQQKPAFQDLREYTHSQPQNKKEKLFKIHNLQEGPSTVAVLRSEDALLYYKQIQSINQMNNILSTLFPEKSIKGYLPSSNNQETYTVGVKAVMKSDDTVITSCRPLEWAVVMGEPVHAIVAGLMGKSTRSSMGKRGSMYTYYKNLFGLENNVQLGVGIGFAHKYNSNGAVSFTVFEGGSFNQVQTKHALKLAKLRNLPVVFIVENNMNKKNTLKEHHSARDDFYKQGDNIPGVRLDTKDLLTVREAAKFARNFASEKGPIILDLITEADSTSSSTYNRIDDTIDTLARFQLLITQSGLINEDDLKRIKDEAKNVIETAIEKAKSDPQLDEKELVGDVCAQYSDAIRLCEVSKSVEHEHFEIHKTSNDNS